MFGLVSVYFEGWPEFKYNGTPTVLSLSLRMLSRKVEEKKLEGEFNHAFKFQPIQKWNISKLHEPTLLL